MSQSKEGEHVFPFLAFGLFSLVEIALKQTLPHGIFFSSAPAGSVAEEARIGSTAEEVFTNLFPFFTFTLHFQNVLVCIL